MVDSATVIGTFIGTFFGLGILFGATSWIVGKLSRFHGYELIYLCMLAGTVVVTLHGLVYARVSVNFFLLYYLSTLFLLNVIVIGIGERKLKLI